MLGMEVHPELELIYSYKIGGEEYSAKTWAEKVTIPSAIQKS